MTIKKGFSRRQFLSTTAIGLAGVTILPSISSCVTSSTAKPIRLGFIGLGRQAIFLLQGFANIPDVTVVAGCDVYGRKRERFENEVKGHYAENKMDVEVKTYERFQDLLSRDDIDAVVIATPDHWHAIMAIEACKAGKDIYLEKPMTFTIKEGQELVKAVRQNNCVLGIGSQQRSDPNFQHAVKLAQTGALGKIEKVNAFVGPPPSPYDLPVNEIPEDLNWDLWLGPLPGDIHFNHDLNPLITLDPPKNEDGWGCWRYFKETGGGFTTDWGAHMFDIAQWGLGMDRNGPIEIAPIGDGSKYIRFKYANGIEMTSEPYDEEETRGVKFYGDKGWVSVTRGGFDASNEVWMPEGKEQDDMPYETRIPHQVDFIDAVRERKDPIAPVEVGHSTCTVCSLGNIAVELGRPVQWDPATQTFVNEHDGKAASLLHYKYRAPWKLV